MIAAMGDGVQDNDDPRRTSPFERWSADDLLALVDEYPLAWVTAAGGAAPPSLLPLLAETDGDGRPVSLFGHMARRNPLAAAFAADGRGTILFRGPEAFVPTTAVSDPHWAPTWVYAQASFAVTVRLVPDETAESIERLTLRLERRAGSDWRPEMVGARYDAMVGAVVAFRAEIHAMHARFKLGQDETPERLAEIVAALDDAPLARWIDRFDRRRGRD